jgi:membrane protease YdiL (CAAX protease family)
VDWFSIFVNASYQIRAGWRFLGYCALLVGLWAATAIVVGGFLIWVYPAVLTVPKGNPAYLALNSIVLFFPSVGALLFMARFADQTPATAFGASFHDHWRKDFGVGIGVAAGMLGLTVAGSFLLGEVRIAWSGSLSALPGLLLTLAALALSALSEELVFRGYPLQVLMKGLRPWGSMILISSLFGAIHGSNPGATGLSVLGTILAGIALSVAYLKTRSVWFPYGIHLGWNVGLSMVLGYPMSGIQTASILKTEVSGSTALLGGEYGPEAGILGMVVFVLTAVVIHRMRTVRVSPQVRAAVEAHAKTLYVGDL